MEPISPATYRAFCHDLLTLSDSFVRHDDELQILAVFFRNSPFILPFSFLFLPVHFCLHIMAIIVLRFSFYAITLDKTDRVIISNKFDPAIYRFPFIR
jgi:hypothetical protein